MGPKEISSWAWWMNEFLTFWALASVDSCSFRNLLAFLSQNTCLPLISTPKWEHLQLIIRPEKSSIQALASCHSLSTRTLEDTNHRLVGRCQVGHYSIALTIEYSIAKQYRKYIKSGGHWFVQIRLFMVFWRLCTSSPLLSFNLFHPFPLAPP